MRAGKRIVICACSLWVLLACDHKEIVPTDVRELRKVSVAETEVVVPVSGVATLSMSVDSPVYTFNYDVASAGCQVRLMLQGGMTPTAFSMVSITPTERKGQYKVSLKDNGQGEIYKEQVCLALVKTDEKTGNSSLVTSSYFTVRSEQQYKGPVIETGLPIVYVDTDGGKNITSKTEWMGAGMYVRGNAEYPSLSQVLPCEIRGRGNTTWTWPKKPYLIKLDSKASILGMPKHKRWVLLANFMDRTLMRNLVSMHVASMTSLAWTPRCVPVELVLNGKHQGSYLLIEQVRVDKNRVNISEEEGYLLELDFHYDNEFQWKERNIPFAVKNPDPDELTAEQKTYIKNYIKEVSNVIYGNDFKDPEKGYAQYLDVDSFIDEWIVYEVMCNHELGNPGSVFFHKDKDGLLKAGPVWDFDWGVLSFYTSNGANGLVNGKAIWYARLFQDPAFKQRVKARFQELLPQLETIPEYMEECRALLKKSAELNFQMWNPADDKSQNGGNIINGDENLSFDAAIDRLKKNYNTHLGVIKNNL